MQPTPAEVARTLVAGHLPATAQVACRPGRFPVRHVTDPHGRILLLSPHAGALRKAMTPTAGASDTALVLDVTDVPPVADAPSRGRAWISGWATELTGDEARTAALDYADLDPTGDLLDVGDTWALHRLEVVEVRHEVHGTLIDIDLDDYAEANPDPLRTIEFDLITELAGHHRAEFTEYLRRQLGPAARPIDEPHAVRVDRYGFLVRVADRVARLRFPRPVADRHDLARLLHPILCRHCDATATI